MAKSNSSTTSPEKNAASESDAGTPRQHKASGTNGTERSDVAEYVDLMDQARTWIEENQTAAMLGGFGFGVFIGVLLRR